MDGFIPVNEPRIAENAKKYVLACLESGWISAEGPLVPQFEQQVAESVRRRYGIAVANGTAALEIAVKALGIGPGDEVIVPTFTIISCAAAVLKAGAKPVFVDCEPDTWNMSAEMIEGKLTKKTKAIMIVHIYGLPVDVEPIMKLADHYQLKIIEDAAEMQGQSYKGRPCGSFGDVSIFSFYSNKQITTGEGGMILTDHEGIAQKCRSYRNLCFDSNRRFVHEELGFNYRMTNIQAALGIAQMEQLDEFVRIRRKMGKRYTELLSDIEGIQLPVADTAYATNIYWVFGIVLNDAIPFDNETAMKRLAEKGIGTRPFFWPMHEQPVFKRRGLSSDEKFPVSERIARRGFYIPSGLAITDEQMEIVAERLIEVTKRGL